jgi:hypothetical protein
MMRLARHAGPVLALSLLTTAATAHAECAWVLWSWSAWDERSGKSWDTEGVWKSQEDCLRQLRVHKGAAEAAKKEGRGTFTEHPSMLTVVYDVPKGRKRGESGEINSSPPACPTPWTRVGRRRNERRPDPSSGTFIFLRRAKK